MTTSKDRYIAWLRDAHAMEEQAERLLEGCAGRLDEYPEFRDLLTSHKKEIEGNANAIARCIERLGKKVSTLKDVAARITAAAQSLSGLFVGDEAVKALMAIYTFQHMKISAYRILMVAAERFEDVETREICERHLHREEEMVEALRNLIPSLTDKFLAHSDNGETSQA